MFAIKKNSPNFLTVFICHIENKNIFFNSATHLNVTTLYLHCTFWEIIHQWGISNREGDYRQLLLYMF